MAKFTYSSLPEQEISINLPDSGGLKIKGILRGDYTQPLTIIVHGRPGHGNELLPFLFAHYLAEKGIASLRLSMYGFTKNTRNLLETSLDTNSQDFETVVKFLRSQGVKKVFGVGHSYGGLTILKSPAKLDAAVLWDPTHGLAFQRDADKDDYGDFPEKECGDYIITTSGYGFVTTKAAKQYDNQLGDTTESASRKGYPLKVISAGKGIMVDLGKRYIDVADEPKEHYVITDAHHQLEDSDDVISELFYQTANWLKK